MQQVADNLTGPMPSEVHRVLQEMRIGISRTEALRALSVQLAAQAAELSDRVSQRYFTLAHGSDQLV